MDNDNVQSLDGYSSRIGEAVGWLKMSEEEKLEYIKDQIKHEEDKDFINKTVKAAEKAAEKEIGLILSSRRKRCILSKIVKFSGEKS